MIPMLRLMTLCSSLLITILPAAAQVGNEPYTETDTVASDIYLVGRGETLEDVARAYQLSTEQLLAMNPDFEVFYTGMKLCVPRRQLVQSSNLTNASSSTALNSAYEDACIEAKRYFDKGDYRRAQKIYGNLLKEYADALPCADARYMYALCSYRRQRWKSAIKDLAEAAADPASTDSARDLCRTLLSKAREYREQQLAERAENWGNFLFSLATVGAQVASAAMSNSYSVPQNNMGGIGQSLGSMSNAEFNAYVNNSLQAIAQQTVIQTQQQMAAEERQFKVGYAATYRQLYGKSPTNDELQAAYNDYMQSKANGYNARRIADAENSSSNTPRQRTTESVQCKQCFDKHTCKICNGSGWQDAGVGDTHNHGGGIGKIKCGNCKGTGVCPSCK